MTEIRFYQCDHCEKIADEPRLSPDGWYQLHVPKGGIFGETHFDFCSRECLDTWLIDHTTTDVMPLADMPFNKQADD